MQRRVWVTLAAAVVFGTLFGCSTKPLDLALPTFPRPQQIVWASEGWDAGTAAWFHHADQGTQTFPIPYEWFVALEHASIQFAPGQMLADPDYLDRYGFIPDDQATLPIGFAHGGQFRGPDDLPWENPSTGKPLSRIGLTCAACHTGRLTYNGTEIRFDGAPANTNLKLFQEHLVLALLETKVAPLRLRRFEDRILGSGATAAAKLALAAQIKQVLAGIDHTKELEDRVASESREEGFGRLDALSRIGNQVFSLDLNDGTNYAPESAPVHFPRIWDASWFAWVQYDGSIAQQCGRSTGRGSADSSHRP